MVIGKAWIRVLLLNGLFICSGSVEAQAVDPKLHKLCIEAKDYAGCIRSMKGDEATIRVINQESAPLPAGNSCPIGYAYRGGGLCQAVVCPIEPGGNEPMLAGKNHKCGNAPFWSGWMGRLPLRWGAQTARAFVDPNCPSGEPLLGWTSTCDTTPVNSTESGAKLQK